MTEVYCGCGKGLDLDEPNNRYALGLAHGLTVFMCADCQAKFWKWELRGVWWNMNNLVEQVERTDADYTYGELLDWMMENCPASDRDKECITPGSAFVNWVKNKRKLRMKEEGGTDD